MNRITRSFRVQSISITVQVDTTVTRGAVSEDELADWVRHAVDDYHRFRAGHVGFDAHGNIKLPTVTRRV